MQLIIDRFEGEFAICEKQDRSLVKVKRSQIPAKAREGDVLNMEGNTARIDLAETAKRKKAASDLMNDLWKS